MKVFVLASLLGAASAFAPIANTGARVSTKLDAAKKSQALPFLPAPANLEGCIGNYGFDPLGISEYFPVEYLQESEIKHGRIAMLAWFGFVSVDMGLRVYPVPAWEEGLTSVTAHNAAVEAGAMGQIFLGIAIFECIGWMSISQMLQGSGRQPGDYNFDPLGIFQGKSQEFKDEWRLKEIKNGRAAMMAFAGVVTQSVLNDTGFPYV